MDPNEPLKIYRDVYMKDINAIVAYKLLELVKELLNEEKPSDKPKGPEWKTIDSAPTDGSLVLLFEKRPYVGVYSKHHDAGSWFIAGNLVVDPTHWMALPEPPEQIKI